MKLDSYKVLNKQAIDLIIELKDDANTELEVITDRLDKLEEKAHRHGQWVESAPDQPSEPPMTQSAKAMKVCGYEVFTFNGTTKWYYYYEPEDRKIGIPTDPTIEWAMQRLEEYCEKNQLCWMSRGYGNQIVCHFKDRFDDWNKEQCNPTPSYKTLTQAILEAIVKHSEVGK